MDLHNSKSVKRALRTFKYPKLISWIIWAFIILVLGMAMNVYTHWWFPRLFPSVDSPPTKPNAQPFLSRVDLDYPTSVLVGTDVWIVATYIENGIPVEGKSVEFINNTQLNGSFASRGQSTDGNGQITAIYTPMQEGGHQIEVLLPDKEIISIASIQVLPRSDETSGGESDNPVYVDSEADGLSDMIEKRVGTDPNISDTDNDGITDSEEFYSFNTDPLHSNILEVVGNVNVRSIENASVSFGRVPDKFKVFNLNQLYYERTDTSWYQLVFFDVRVKKIDLTNDIDTNTPYLSKDTPLIDLDSDTELMKISSDKIRVQFLREDENYYYLRVRAYIAVTVLSTPAGE